MSAVWPRLTPVPDLSLQRLQDFSGVGVLGNIAFEAARLWPVCVFENNTETLMKATLKARSTVNAIATSLMLDHVSRRFLST
jgi:hypothetical protein